MRIINPLQLNDSNIKSFLKGITLIQLAMWGAIGLDAVGLQIPIIRQLIGFVYLTFIPGIVILRILKLHKLCNIETLLYTVGLSIATLMFTGLFMNMVYPLFGVSGPILTTPLVITISAVVLILCVLSYVRDKDFSDPSYINVENVLSPPALFLCLIPFLAILGTYLVNYHDKNNVILLLLIVVIAFIVFLIASDRFIHRNFYPLAVFTIAIALMYHRSLISPYLMGYADVHYEYYFCKLVEINSYWDPTIAISLNAMMSIVMLAPIFSHLLNMDIAWIFKIIYPLLYSFAPLGLYHLFQKQTDEKTAFLSVFFFMAVSTFYFGMPSLCRQQIAELFFILLILVIIDRNTDFIKRRGLFILFSFGMIISHYGVSYIYMFSSLFVLGILFYVLKYKSKIFTISSVLLFTTMILSWYMYTASSVPFDSIVNIGDHIYESIFTDIFNPMAREGTELMLIELPSPLHETTRILHYITQFFITVGITKLILKHKEMKFNEEYTSFSIVNFGILIACIVIPTFSDKLNMPRMYHLTLIFLAPFCIIGGEIIFGRLIKIVRYIRYHNINQKYMENGTKRDVNQNTPKVFVSIILITCLLFNTGFVYEIAKDNPCSIPLSMKTVDKYADNEDKAFFYSSYTFEQNVFSARWLSKSADPACRIRYSDVISGDHILNSFGMMGFTPTVLNVETAYLRSSLYIYLSYSNVVYGLMVDYGRSCYNISECSYLLEKMNRIYTNGGSEIYYYE